MIYLINGKYYVKISPLTYSEIKLELKGEDLNLVPIGNGFLCMISFYAPFLRIF